MIAVVVITYNRAHLLPRCVEDVVLRASAAVTEVVIWDNASDDETGAYLETITDPRFRIVRHDANIGTNAYARAVELTTTPYIVELDDDVIEAPPNWDQAMLHAFTTIPKMGYLVADLKEDPNDSAYRYMSYVKEHKNVHTRREIDGITILEGPTGGGCAMTSREVYERAGGFRQHKKLVFWHEAAAYVRDVKKAGFRTAILEDVKVWHAGSPYYSKPSPAKGAFHEHYAKASVRKNRIKKLILALPFAAALNERFRLFDPPDTYRPPDFGRSWE